MKSNVRISARTNDVLNSVKAMYSLKNRSLALDKIAEEYEAHLLRPFRPAMQRKLERILRQMKQGIGVKRMTQEEAVAYFKAL